jgi:hypothetical protein
VGLSTLANALSEDTDTIEDVYEPYLLQQGLLLRTPKGRMATERAFEHCGVAYEPEILQGTQARRGATTLHDAGDARQMSIDVPDETKET